MTGVSLTVIVPMYNEESTIEELLRRLSEVDPGCAIDLVVVDDASSDNSRSIAEQTLLQLPLSSTVVMRPCNGGKGAAVAAGLVHAAGTHIAVLDADLELEPEALPAMVAPILTGDADAVIGYRRAAHTRLTRISLQRLPYQTANGFLTMTFNVWHRARLRDVMSGYKVLPALAWTARPLSHQGFAVEIELAARACVPTMRLAQVPVRYVPRMRKDGKKIKARDALLAMMAIVRPIRNQPSVGQGPK